MSSETNQMSSETSVMSGETGGLLGEICDLFHLTNDVKRKNLQLFWGIFY